MNASAFLSPVYELYELGGFVTLILAVLSIVSLTMILAKLWQFASIGVGRRRAGENAVEAWVAGRNGEALKTAEASKSPLASVVAAAIRGVSTPSLNRQTVEEDVQRIAQEKIQAMSSGLRLLEAIAQIAPLLGLFGTVLGMIQAFQAMQTAGSDIDPSQLAGGIWVALLTTAVGLAVAMPTQLVTTWFDSRIDHERTAIEVALSSVFTRRVTERPLASTSRARDTQTFGATRELAPGE